MKDDKYVNWCTNYPAVIILIFYNSILENNVM